MSDLAIRSRASGAASWSLPARESDESAARSPPLQHDHAIIRHVQPLATIEVTAAVGMFVLTLYLDRRPGRIQALDVSPIRKVQIGERLPAAPPAEVGDDDVVVCGTAREDE